MNGLQISEGTNRVGFVRWNLGFCLCAVSSSAFTRIKIKLLGGVIKPNKNK